MKRVLIVFAAIAAISMSLCQVHAAVLLDGETVGYQYLFPTTSSVFYQPPDFVVGAGVELPGLFSAGADAATFDVSDTNIYVDYYPSSYIGWNPGAFNGFRLYDSTSSIAAITSVTINAVTNMVGFGPANVSFDADNVYVNWQGLPFDASTIVSLDLNTSSAGVPAPSSLLTWCGVMAVVASVGVVRARRIVTVS